jgi:tetratricopeptide (TPR) repeat protein
MPDHSNHVEEEVDAYVHDVLDTADRERVQRHLVDCPACRLRLAEARQRLEALRSLPVETASEGLIRRTERRLDQAERHRHRGWRVRWLIAAALAGVALVVFAPSIADRFIALDDPYYVFQNPNVRCGLTRESAIWAFTTFDICNWHPLTWLSLQLDVSLWNMTNGELDARAFHLTNVLLHAANAGLLYLALRRLTVGAGAAAATALLFAVHPLRAESVAWVSERKDVLCTFFGLLALWAWARYVAIPSVAGYVAAAVALTFSLMAKPMLVTFPCLLLVLDWWPLERARSLRDWPRLLVEKLPLFVLGAASAAITYYAQAVGGATRTLGVFTPAIRIENAAVSYVAYLSKTVWPTGLAFYYPHRGASLTPASVGVCALILLAVTLAAVSLRRRAPYLLTGWLWYLGTLVPVIGLVQVGDQAMANRYTYFPTIGLLLAICLAVAQALANRPRVAVAAVSVAAVALTVLTEHQLWLWQKPFELYEYSLRTTGPNRAIYACLAAAHEDRKELDEAEACFRKALEAEPNEILTLTSLGGLLSRQGRLEEAQNLLETARDEAPKFPLVRVQLESVYYRQGKLGEAVRELLKYCELVPNSPEGYNDLGTIYLQQRKFPEAANLFRKACQVNPKVSKSHLNLGIALEELEDFAGAADSYATAARLQSDFSQARASLGVALIKLGRRDEGLEQLRVALRTNPNFARGHVLLGKALANGGDFQGAAAHLGEAARLDPKDAATWADLGKVQQRLGQTDAAAESLRRAAEIDPRFGPAGSQPTHPSAPR